MKEKASPERGTFLVFNSAGAVSGRIVCALLPAAFMIAFNLASNIGTLTKYLLSAVIALILWGAMLANTPLLQADADGLHFYRAFFKSIHMPWKDVKYVNKWNKKFGYGIYTQKESLLCFSSKPVPKEFLSCDLRVPRAEEGFVFCADSPRLRCLLEEYLNK